MSRKPTVDGDLNSWGTVLNDFLSVGHNSDGTILQGKVIGNCLLGSAITAGDNTFTTDRDFSAFVSGVRLQYVIVDAFTANAEYVRLENLFSTSPRTVSIRAFGGAQTFAYSHAAGAIVLFPVGTELDVQWFGVSPEGTDTTTSAAVQSMITQAEAMTQTGVTIKFPSGRFNFSSRLQIANPTTRIRGDGSGKTTLIFATDLGTDVCAIDIKDTAKNTPGVQLEGFSLQGTSTTVTLGGSPASRTDIGINAKTRIRMKDVKVSGFKVGIRCNFIDHTTWDEVWASNCQYGLYFYQIYDDGTKITSPAGGDILFRKCEFSTNGIAGIALGPMSGTINSAKFEDCHFGYQPVLFYVEPDDTGNNPVGKAGGLIGVQFYRCSVEHLGNKLMVTNSGATTTTIQMYNGWGALGWSQNATYNWSGMTALGEDTTLLQSTLGGSPNFVGFYDGMCSSASGYDLFRARFLGSACDIDLQYVGLSNLVSGGNKIFRYTGTDVGPFPNVKIRASDPLRWAGSGYASTTTGTVTRGDLLELSSGQARVYQTAGAAPIGVAMEVSNADTHSVSAVADKGVARINVQSTNTITAGSYLKPDGTNAGKVVAATGFSDGPIVGVALKAHEDNAVTSWGSTRTVLCKLS